MSPSEVRSVGSAACGFLATALRELTMSSSAAQVAGIAARAARQLCDADSLHFQWLDGSFPATFESGAIASAIQASLTVAPGVPQQDALMTVNWNSPHVVTDLDREYLEILAQAGALALRPMTAPAARLATGGFEPLERARFFDFQRQVRSLLATIRSIVRRMADTPGSVEEYAAHLEGRLGAIARIQGFLLRAPDALVDLEELVRSEFLAQSIRDEQLVICGPRVLLAPKTAETVGLALHELTTNSIKFGALVESGDRVQVQWRLEHTDHRRVVLEWRERVARALPMSETRGFGFELIEQTLPYELGGTSSIAVQPDGLQCSLVFAVPPHEHR